MLQGRGKRSRRTLHPDRDRQSRGADLFGELVECGKAGCRCRIARAQRADHAAQLRKRLATRPFSRFQSGAFILLLGTKQAPHGTRLKQDHPQTMADDVVKFACDALALELDRELCVALLLGS